MASPPRLLVSALLSLSLALSGCSSDSGAGSGPPGGGGNGGSGGEGDAGGGGPAFGDTGTWTGGDTSAPGEEMTCETDADCPSETPFCSPSGLCFVCGPGFPCPSGEVCQSGLCLPQLCTPGEKICSGSRLLTCEANGTWGDPYECPGETGWCKDGACVGCDPGYAECTGKSERMVCPPDGSALITETCPGEDLCVEGECLGCYPSTKQCVGEWAQVCDTAGVWNNDEDCAASGASCVEGVCQSPCGQTGKLSNEGCDYWAVDMDNEGPAKDSPYAVIVSNLNDYPVEIDITSRSSEAVEPTTIAEGTVQPGGLEIFELPQMNLGATGTFWKAIRVQSTGPIVAYQFNPLSNVEVYSNDASLLLPSGTYGTEYVVVSREQLEADTHDGAFRGSIAVVAVAADTKVTITPSAPCMGGGGLLALNTGQTATVTIQPYQVLNFQSGAVGADLTGTIITSDKPVGVFGGHEAAVGADQCCADHLEQQLFPVSTWGKTYVATKSFPRGLEQDYWRLVAATDGTQVTLTPAVPGVPGTISLNRGEFYEFKTDLDVLIQATEPIMVAQTLPSSFEGLGPPGCTSDSQCPAGHVCMSPDFISPAICLLTDDFCMSASDCPQGYNCVAGGLFGMSCQPMGDPALILSAPVEQFRERYVFLTPTNYLDDYVNIVATPGTSVTLDGVPVSASQFTPVASGTYTVVRLKVSDGVHSLEASAPVGVVVYGYDDDVSYGYPAGLSLSSL